MKITKFYEGMGIILMLIGQGIVITGGDWRNGLFLMIGGLVFYISPFYSNDGEKR